MKKGYLLVFFLILILPLVYSANEGVSICNVDRDCGIADNICPEDFFAEGISCYIKDPDCCSIEKASWSTTSDTETSSSEIREGESVYMYVETKNCKTKDAYFDVYRIEERLFLPDKEYFVTTFGPKAVNNNRVNVRWTSFTDPSDEGLSKFKFKVRINPELESSVIEVESSGGTSSSCNDLIDNDADGCSDEADDCIDGNENNPDIKECPTFDQSKCCPSNICWKCTVGECVSGFKSVDCPALPNGCDLAVPPPTVRCYEKSTPFPFFSGFNAGIVILLLTGYYGFRIYKRK